MAREAVTGEPVQASFGGAYEVLYLGQKGFERVDDVMHFFTTVNVTTKNIDISMSPIHTRQWYEGDQMLIASFSTPEAHQQGLEFKAFGIPSVLKEMAGSIRTYEWLVSQPKYLCIHHLFKIEGRRFPSVMTIRGTAIDEMFRISRTENKWKFEPTDAYKERVRLQAQVVVRDEFAAL